MGQRQQDTPFLCPVASLLNTEPARQSLHFKGTVMNESSRKDWYSGDSVFFADWITFFVTTHKTRQDWTGSRIIPLQN